MKKIVIILISILACNYNYISAKEWRVNNIPGRSCDFTTLTEALKSPMLQPNDILHIESSPYTYGLEPTAAEMDTVLIPLRILGPGYFLSINTETQHNKPSARIKSLYIAPGAKGSTIAGLEQEVPSPISGYRLPSVYEEPTPIIEPTLANLWKNNHKAYKLRIEADNILVTNCRLYYVDIYNARPLTNITITKCFFNPGIVACVADNQPVANLIISHNFFRNEYHMDNYQHQERNCIFYLVIDLRGKNRSAIVQNENWINFYNKASWPVFAPLIISNTFYGRANLAVKSGELYNNLFFFYTQAAGAPDDGGAFYGLPVWPGIAEHVTRNNVVSSLTSRWNNPTVQLTPGQYNNNYGGMLNDADNTYVSAQQGAEATWFEGPVVWNRNPTYDYYFKLKEGSPALDPDPTKQRGMFGGLQPYILSGLFSIPAIWDIAFPSYPTSEVPVTGFDVEVKAKSH